MTQEEINVIEKYLSKEEIQEIIREELKGKLRHDFSEMYYQTLFSPANKYINNVVYAIFKDYVLEHHAEELAAKSKELVNKLTLEYVIGSTWDRKDHPEAINKLDGMKIINKAFEESIPEIKEKIISTINSKSEDVFYSEFADAYTEKIFMILDSIRNPK